MKFKDEFKEMLERNHETSIKIAKKLDDFIVFLLKILDNMDEKELRSHVKLVYNPTDIYRKEFYEITCFVFEAKTMIGGEPIDFKIAKYFPLFIAPLKPHDIRDVKEDTIIRTFEEVLEERAIGHTTMIEHMRENREHLHVYLFESNEIALIFQGNPYCVI
nr:MAG: hypothetical protein [Lokiarchaeota virus Skoll Meg22_1214]